MVDLLTTTRVCLLQLQRAQSQDLSLKAAVGSPSSAIGDIELDSSDEDSTPVVRKGPKRVAPLPGQKPPEPEPATQPEPADKAQPEDEKVTEDAVTADAATAKEDDQQADDQAQGGSDEEETPDDERVDSVVSGGSCVSVTGSGDTLWRMSIQVAVLPYAEYGIYEPLRRDKDEDNDESTTADGASTPVQQRRKSSAASPGRGRSASLLSSEHPEDDVDFLPRSQFGYEDIEETVDPATGAMSDAYKLRLTESPAQAGSDELQSLGWNEQVRDVQGTLDVVPHTVHHSGLQFQRIIEREEKSSAAQHAKYLALSRLTSDFVKVATVPSPCDTGGLVR